jgi:hypothetical protein
MNTVAADTISENPNGSEENCLQARNMNKFDLF